MNYESRKQGYASLVGKPAGSKVAIIGTGLAGFGCAEILAQKGHEVTIIESKPAKSARREELERAGIKFVPNNDIGNDKTIDSLFEEGFNAVFIDINFRIDEKMKNTPGMNLSGVYDATDFLARANMEPDRLSENKPEPLEIGRRVVVIGGGDSTPACLQTVLKLGSDDVTCLCQHSEDELPVEIKGQKTARVEGAKYRFLTQPVKFLAGADGKLAAVECVELKPGGPDAKGCRELIPVEGSNFSVAADTAILSDRPSDIEKYLMDESAGPTLRAGVFISVDYAAGGRSAALAIDEYLRNKK